VSFAWVQNRRDRVRRVAVAATDAIVIRAHVAPPLSSFFVLWGLQKGKPFKSLSSSTCVYFPKFPK
jgi:hypothetical protein